MREEFAEVEMLCPAIHRFVSTSNGAHFNVVKGSIFSSFAMKQQHHQPASQFNLVGIDRLQTSKPRYALLIIVLPNEATSHLKTGSHRLVNHL